MDEIHQLLYQHLSKNENRLNITLDKTAPIEIDTEILNNCEIDIKERLKIKLVSGICTSLLIEQLSFHKANYGEKFGDKVEFFNSSEILELIERLENKKVHGLPFNNEPLKSYLHIHLSPYSSLGYSIVRNVREYWFNQKGEIKSSKIDDFEKILERHKDATLSAIAIQMHLKAIASKDLKGEWLIYKVSNGKNFYLCLASHREGKDRKESDRNIFNEKITKCLIEFPELN